MDFFQYGKEYFRSGDLDRAEYYFKIYLENHESYEAYFFLGMVMSQKNQLEEALECYYKSVLINPDFGNPCNEIGIILMRMGKEKDALFWLKKSLRCSRNDAPHISLFNLATLYRLWNRPERSLQYLHKAMEIQPEFPEAIQLKKDILNQFQD